MTKQHFSVDSGSLSSGPYRVWTMPARVSRLLEPVFDLER